MRREGNTYSAKLALADSISIEDDTGRLKASGMVELQQ